MKSEKQDSITNSLLWAGNSFLLDSLFEQSPLGLYVIDEKFRFVKVSKFLAHQVCGQPVNDLVGKPLSKVFDKKTWPILRQYFTQALAGEYIHDVPITIEESGETDKEKHFLLTIYPLPEIKEGKLIGGLFQEITRQYEAEEELLSYQQRLEMAQNAGGVGIFEWDFDTNEVWSSPEEIELFELKNPNKQEKLGHWLSKIHPQDKQRILELIEQSSENHVSFDTEFRILLSNNRQRWIRGKGKFSYNDKGEAVQLLGVNYDITQRKKEDQFLRFKAESSRVLVSSLNAKKTLQQMSSLATKYIADWCCVDFCEGPLLKQIAYSSKDSLDCPVTQNQLSKILHKVVSTKEVVILPSLNPKSRGKHTKLPPNSLMILPLVVQDKGVGTITFVLAESSGQYTATDLELAQQLATRVSLFLENITLYDQIKSERKRLLKLFENVPCVVFELQGSLVNRDFHATFINSYVKEMMGYPIKNWLTIPGFGVSLIHPEDRSRVIAETTKTLEQKTEGIARYRWQTRAGNYIWVESRFNVMLNDKGETTGLRGVITNVTERMALEERKDDFIASASHELKTPLTSLKVFSQILKANKEISPSSKLHKYILRMEKEVDRLTELVFELLDLSKIQRGQLSLTKKSMSLTALLKDLVRSIQPSITQKLVFENPITVQVHADQQRLSQVFSNLISNAAKYSPDTSTILIKMTQKGKKIVVSVVDQGIGIAPEYHDQVFQRFYRVSEKKDKTFPGLGMGLFISKTIVKHHNGQIWLESKPKMGSTFYVSLPMKTAPRSKNEKSRDH